MTLAEKLSTGKRDNDPEDLKGRKDRKIAVTHVDELAEFENGEWYLYEIGYETVVFYADSCGGREMELKISSGDFVGVLDLATAELAATMLGGVMATGCDRLTAAALHGVPQVISVGGIDAVLVKKSSANYSDRRSLNCGRFGEFLSIRTTPEENDQLGREIALKASASRGPTAIILPMRGISALDIEGGPFWWPEADAALFQSIRNWLAPNVKLVELDRHINDPEFSEEAARMLVAMIDPRKA